jgi:pimeloyl-ACP methyl ester carboxylesterase
MTLLRLSLFGFVLLSTSWLGAAQAAPLTEHPCHIDAVETPVRCTTVAVPLDWSAPTGKTIDVTAVVVPALTARPAADPLLVLAGGPGQAASDLGPWLATAFKGVRQSRDIVLFDMRGTGLSGKLDCKFDMSLGTDSMAALNRDAAACVARFGDALRFYTHREIVDDIEAWRAAAGIARLNIWGGSFGTRIAQHYARKYPAHARALVLDAATPVGLSIFASGPIDGQAALERLAQDCAADAACAKLTPDFLTHFDALLAKVEQHPLESDIADPRTGDLTHVVIDRDGLAGIVRGALYAAQIRALVPYAIVRAEAGDPRPLAAMASATNGWAADTQSLGMMFSVLCAEDVAQVVATKANVSGGFMRDIYYRSFAVVCAKWPTTPLPQSMEQLEGKLSAPALVISGDADPVTPPRLGAMVLSEFTTAVHAIVPGGLHTNSSRPCVAKLIASFVADPQTGARDQTCLKRIAPPRFVVSATGLPG